MAFANLLHGFKNPFSFGNQNNSSADTEEEDSPRKPKMPKLALGGAVTEAPTTGSSPNPSAGAGTGNSSGSGVFYTPPAPKSNMVAASALKAISKRQASRPVAPSAPDPGVGGGLDYGTPGRQPVELSARPVLDDSLSTMGSPSVLPEPGYNERQQAVARIAPKKWGQLKPYADAANSGDPIDSARYDYINQQAGHGRAQRILMPMLAGALRGIATTGSPWGALGGALGGTGMGIFNPDAAAGMQYDTFREPGDQASLQRQMQIAKARNDANLANVKMQGELAQGNYRNAQARDITNKSQEGQYLNTGAGIFNTRRGMIPGTAPVKNEEITSGAGISWKRDQTGKLMPLIDQNGIPVPSETMMTTRANITSREKIAQQANALRQQLDLMHEIGVNTRYYDGLQQKIEQGMALDPTEIQTAAARYTELKNSGNLQPDDPELAWLTNILGGTGQFETGVGDKNYPYIKPRINSNAPPPRTGLAQPKQAGKPGQAGKPTASSFSVFDDQDLAVVADRAFGGDRAAARKALEAKGKKYVMQAQ